ncbi:hypothetical protein PV08_10712 [Exophiala spinifera]|uniref:Short-chain dehydrogenase n=1 Tax=Exophiala spinifera TaxID=91928 RepID=A0A0D1ZEL4_9EURO|nr:uncharacterized protein PV08_10712 [Exophiala spinifera]KIW11412.1 hypothetical protein PV08_10712 [Exophiala spinifera]
MSSPASKVALILGAGPNIGKHVAGALSAKGYKVALASRTNHGTAGDQIYVPVDLARPDTVAGVFDQVKDQLGAPPSVVVYNGALRIPNDAADPLSTSSFKIQDYDDSVAVNTTSAIVALQHAVAGFRSLPQSPNATAETKTFIFTGNILNVVPVPGVLTFGVTKAATAYAIRNLVETKAYEKDGVRFYYADERAENGGPVFKDIDGPAAAVEYLHLVEQKDQGPWLHTFIKGKGYKDFGERPWTPGQK